MAYNPFNIFRRNQKAIFAVITVVIMFVFVLSSGLGGGADFFDWLPQWLGSRARTGGAHVCTIDGTKIYEAELQRLQSQRQMANRFMALAAQESVQPMQEWALQQKDQLTPEVRRLLDQATGNDPNTRQFIEMISKAIPDPQRRAQLIQQQLSRLQMVAIPRLQALGADEKTPPTDRLVISTLMASSELSLVVQYGRGQQYFLNARNQTHRDLVEFILWQKKADQLGIKFSTDDIKRLIQKEFYNQFRNDAAVRKQMQERTQGFSFEACMRAIGEEFRVRLAQRIYTGPGGLDGVSTGNRMAAAAAVFATPYEVLQFYQEKFSPTSYQVLALPARSLSHLVTGQPTLDEERQLYDKYKDREPDPGREELGLKDPRRIRVAWIGISGTEPYYQKLAAERQGKSEAQARSGNLLSIPLPGVGGAWAAAAVAPLIEPLFPEAVTVYRSYTFRHRADVADRWEAVDYPWLPRGVTLPLDAVAAAVGTPLTGIGPRTTRQMPLDTSFLDPQSLAALVGSELSSLGSLGNQYTALGALYNWASVAETRGRVQAGMQMFFGAVPGPGLAATLPTGRASYIGNLPQPLPAAALRAMWIPDMIKQEARKAAQTDLTKLQTELNDLAVKVKNPSEQAAQAKAVIEKFAAERGLKTGVQFGESTQARDEFTIADDPGLAPLELALRKGAHAGQQSRFGKAFFWMDFDSERSTRPTKGLYVGALYPDPRMGSTSPTDPMYLVWRTEDQPVATKPPTEAEAKNKGKLLAAWQVLKGREMARAQAEGLANHMRATPDPIRASQSMLELQATLKAQVAATGDAPAAERIKLFDLHDVAPLGMFGTPFSLANNPDIRYPTPEMEKTLLNERTKPPGTVFVLEDKPKDTFYVVLLRQRILRGPELLRTEQFAENAFQQEEGKQARESILQLLKQEFKYSATEEQQLKLDAGESNRGEE